MILGLRWFGMAAEPTCWGPSEPQLTDTDGYGRDAVAIACDGSIWRISPKP